MYRYNYYNGKLVLSVNSSWLFGFVTLKNDLNFAKEFVPIDPRTVSQYFLGHN